MQIHTFWGSNFEAVNLFQKSGFKRKKWNFVNYKNYEKRIKKSWYWNWKTKISPIQIH